MATSSHRRTAAAALAAAACLTLAACGSQLEASDVAAVSGGYQQGAPSDGAAAVGDPAAAPLDAGTVPGGSELPDGSGAIVVDGAGDASAGTTGRTTSAPPGGASAPTGAPTSGSSPGSGDAGAPQSGAGHEGGWGVAGGGDAAAGTTGRTTSAPPGGASAPTGAPTSGSSPGSGDAGDEQSGEEQQVGSCDGFDNDQPGVTASTITVANASDISGPVPGIFESARQGTRAYLAYFNASQQLCGHRIELLELDTRADAGADQQAYARACTESFAAVGSMSAFDSGGAATAQKCGLPDLRSTIVNPERGRCTTCFGAQSVTSGLVPQAMPDYFTALDREATQHVALLYINAGAAVVNAAAFKKGWESAGWKIDYFQGIDVAEFNFAPYVQQLKDRDIELVYYVGPFQNTVKLQQAMRQQGYEPKIYLQDSTIYDQSYVEQAGDLAEGVYVYSNIAMFDDTSNDEMQLYRAWLEQVSPGVAPNFFGLYAWSAARLFLQTAVALGGELDRASMVQALGKVSDWTANGLHSPQDVGGKTTGTCQKIIRFSGGSWKQVSKGDYLCGSLASTGVGA